MSLADLWLAILLSAVFVFVASSILHMLLPIHKGDLKKLPGEAEVLEAMRNQGVQPGDYMFPCPASMKDCGSPEMVEKFKQGPVGNMTVVASGPPSMGKSLVQWFLYCVLISFFAAYITTFSLEPGAHYLKVFRLTGTVAVVGYAFGSITNSIWKGTSWWVTLKFIFDGVIYGLLTAGTFGWLWPHAA
jgi:hypothetical protein